MKKIVIISALSIAILNAFLPINATTGTIINTTNRTLPIVMRTQATPRGGNEFMILASTRDYIEWYMGTVEPFSSLSYTNGNSVFLQPYIGAQDNHMQGAIELGNSSHKSGDWIVYQDGNKIDASHR